MEKENELGVYEGNNGLSYVQSTNFLFIFETSGGEFFFFLSNIELLLLYGTLDIIGCKLTPFQK